MVLGSTCDVRYEQCFRRIAFLKTMTTVQVNRNLSNDTLLTCALLLILCRCAAGVLCNFETPCSWTAKQVTLNNSWVYGFRLLQANESRHQITIDHNPGTPQGRF